MKLWFRRGGSQRAEEAIRDAERRLSETEKQERELNSRLDKVDQVRNQNHIYDAVLRSLGEY